MAKKTYRTYTLKSLLLLLNDKDGKSVEVRFRGGIQIDSTSRYSTSNKDIQDLVESCSGFGRDYYLESETATAEEAGAVAEAPVKDAPKPKEEKPVMDNVKGSERFRNLVEMKNRMAELGIELPEGANYQAAKAAAQKEGYDFQIKKK